MVWAAVRMGVWCGCCRDGSQEENEAGPMATSAAELEKEAPGLSHNELDGEGDASNRGMLRKLLDEGH